jgi:hypothetical protein
LKQLIVPDPDQQSLDYNTGHYQSLREMCNATSTVAGGSSFMEDTIEIEGCTKCCNRACSAQSRAYNKVFLPR